MSRFILILLLYWFTILVAFEFGRRKAMETAHDILDKAFLQTKDLINSQIELTKENVEDENETTN